MGLKDKKLSDFVDPGFLSKWLTINELNGCWMERLLFRDSPWGAWPFGKSI